MREVSDFDVDVGDLEGPIEMIEVDVPPGWIEFFAKMIVTSTIMFTCLLLMIWV